MKKAMRKVLACTIALMLMLSIMSSALAVTFYSSSAFRLPPVKARPTKAPAAEATQAPESAEEPADEAAEEPADEAEEAPAPESAEEPADEVEEAPAEEAPAEETEEETPEEEDAEQDAIIGTAVVVLRNEGSSLNVRA